MRLTPPGPIKGPMDPTCIEKAHHMLTKRLLFCIIFPIFFNIIFPKFLGNTLIMSHYWYFWKFAPHLCKESRVPTMLVVLSLPFINHSMPFIYPLFFKMCHPHRKIATINQLIKIDSSSIKYSGENEIILTY